VPHRPQDRDCPPAARSVRLIDIGCRADATESGDQLVRAGNVLVSIQPADRARAGEVHADLVVGQAQFVQVPRVVASRTARAHDRCAAHGRPSSQCSDSR